MKKGSQQFKKIIFAFCILYLTSATLAFAVGEAKHVFTWKDWVWPLINFAILVFIVTKFGRKPIREFLRKRTELIEKSLNEAEEAKELAKKALADVEERLRGLDEEISKILELARKTGESEKESLITQGEALRDKILADTKANIKYELEKAKRSLKSEAALLAVELAEREIRERLSKKEQEKLLEESLAKIGGSK